MDPPACAPQTALSALLQRASRAVVLRWELWRIARQSRQALALPKDADVRGHGRSWH